MVFAWVLLSFKRRKRKHMTSNTTTVVTEESLYSVDFLRVVVHVTHNQHKLNNGVRVDIKRTGDGYDIEGQMESFHPIWVGHTGSYSSQIKIKSLSESTLQIEGNFYKWLHGQNVTGSTDLVGLVFDVVKGLSEQELEIEPTPEQMEAIRQGLFEVSVVDVNKALMFQDKQEAMQYLERLKHNSSYPYRKKDTENNGVYFGKTSKRWLIKYYHKGNEIIANRKHQTAITPELTELAERMIRCEMRIKWTQLQDWDLLTGSQWDEATVKKLIDDAHSKLRMPTPITLPEIPKKFLKFISCFKAGTVVDCYTSQTISKMTADLIRKYGIDVNDYTKKAA